MREKKRILLFSGAFIILLGIALFTLILRNGAITQHVSLISPLPHIFDKNHPSVLASSEFWRPDMTPHQRMSKPDLTAQSAIAYDLTTNTLLYSKNYTQKLPIASLTKIMTALVAFENESLDKKITVSHSASTIGENVMGLSEGEVLPLKDLLYGLILPSGNDSAEAIAQGSTVGRDNFIFLMNKKAQDLGLTNTNFTNPSGLEGDGDQHSTAYDLLVITRYALMNKKFADLVATFEYEIPADADSKAYHLFNDTNLLSTYPGVKGVKTGFTNEAGMCLITYLEYEGHKIIAVVLNSTNRREEMKQLLDFSLESLEIEPPLHL